MKHNFCRHQNECTGCPKAQLSLEEQQQNKIKIFKDTCHKKGFALPVEVELTSLGEGGLRDRVDLTFYRGVLGFYNQEKKVFSVEECPQMSPALWAWFLEFKKIKFPIEKGSVRLRVGNGEIRGAWLDFANVDIKNLLGQQQILQNLLMVAHVEIGQKRKKLGLKNDQLKLLDPDYQSWMSTYVEGKELPLYSLIGNFSQTGKKSNRALVSWIEEKIIAAKAQSIIEFGSGTGNLTFPAAGFDRRVVACENDTLALGGLQKTLDVSPEYQERIEIVSGDFQKSQKIDFAQFDLILVNPPRSGLGLFLNSILQISVSERPPNFIYMSCFMESFLRDAQQLKEYGYSVQSVQLIDQFPQTEHFEILASFNLQR